MYCKRLREKGARSSAVAEQMLNARHKLFDVGIGVVRKEFFLACERGDAADRETLAFGVDHEQSLKSRFFANHFDVRN
jgi:hypothetical protein